MHSEEPDTTGLCALLNQASFGKRLLSQALEETATNLCNVCGHIFITELN